MVFHVRDSVLQDHERVKDKRNSLYQELKRAISLVNPEFFIGENVKGLVTIGEKSKAKYFHNGKIVKLGKVAEAIIKELSEVGKGYNVSYQLHSAKDFGIPQDRERIIIVGVRKDIDFEFKFPKPTHGKGLKPYVTMEEFGIKDIPLKDDEVFREAKGNARTFFHHDTCLEIEFENGMKQVLQFLPKLVKFLHTHPQRKCGM